MAMEIHLIEEQLFTAARFLMEIGATIVLAGILTSVAALLITWRPADSKRRVVELQRAAMLNATELPPLGAPWEGARVTHQNWLAESA